MNRPSGASPPPPPLSRRTAAQKLPRSGADFRIEADAGQRAAIAAALDLPAVSAFSADLHARPAGTGRYAVTGEVRAAIRQLCVLTAEEFDSEVAAPVDAVFADDDRLAAPSRKEVERTLDEEDPPEPLDGGDIDLGALAVEFLALSLDPFPRKPGAVFAAADEGEASSPFAALSALKQGRTP